MTEEDTILSLLRKAASRIQYPVNLLRRHDGWETSPSMIGEYRDGSACVAKILAEFNCGLRKDQFIELNKRIDVLNEGRANANLPKAEPLEAMLAKVIQEPTQETALSIMDACMELYMVLVNLQRMVEKERRALLKPLETLLKA